MPDIPLSSSVVFSALESRVDDLEAEFSGLVAPAPIVWRGDWVTATSYHLGDGVQEAGSSYVCLVAHTSGTFATDLAAVKWQLIAEKGDTGSGGGENYLLSSYASFAAAVTAIGSTKGILSIDTAQNVSTAVTVPATLLIDHKGYLLTKTSSGAIHFAGVGILDPESQVPLFSGFAAGDIDFTGTTYPRSISSSLWDDATWDARAIKACGAFTNKSVKIIANDGGSLTSQITVKAYQHLHLTEGDFLNAWAGADLPQIVLSDNSTLSGEGKGLTRLYESSSTSSNVKLIYASGTVSFPYSGYNENINVHDITLVGASIQRQNSISSAIFLGNVRQGHIWNVEFRNVHGFAAYVGSFGTAGYFPDGWSITNCDSYGTTSQAIGCIMGRNGLIANNRFLEIQKPVLYRSDGVTTSGSSTITSATGLLTAALVDSPIKIIKPGQTTIDGYVASVPTATSLTLKDASNIALTVPYSQSGVSLDFLGSFCSVIDLEPNSEDGVMENIVIANNIFDGRLAQQGWDAMAIQSADIWAAGNIDIHNNTIIGRDDINLKFYSTNVDATANTITINNHGLTTGEKVIPAQVSGTFMSGVTSGAIYWVIVVDNDTIKLANSYAYAKAGTAVDITAVGTGNHIILGYTHMATGITAEGLHSSHVHHNAIQGSSQYGMAITNSDNVRVTDNTLTEVGGGGIPAMNINATVNSQVDRNTVKMSGLSSYGAATDVLENEITTYIVNTSGTTVSIISGGSRFRKWWEGKTVTINSVDYTIETILSVYTARLTASAGTQSSVNLTTKGFSSNTYDRNKCGGLTLSSGGTSEIISGYNDRTITNVADADYTATTVSGIIVYTSITTGRTVTLPAAATCRGKEIVIKDGAGGAGAHTITIDGNGAETVDGAASITITTNYGKATVKSNGVGWITV